MHLVSRLFSVASYGEVVLIFTVHNILYAMFNFGLPVVLQKSISENKINSKGVFEKYIYFNTAILSLYFLASFVLYFLLYKEVNTFLYTLISLTIAISSYLSLAYSVNYGLLNYKYQFYNSFFIRLLTIISLIICSIVFNASSISFFVIVLILGNILIFVSLYLNIGKNKKGAYSAGTGEILSLLKISYPFAMLSMVNFLYTKIDVVLISGFLPVEDISYYNVGYGVFTAAQLFFGFLLTGGFSEVSSFRQNHKAVKLFFRKYLGLIFIISSVLTVIILFFSAYLIQFIWGHRYINSIPVLNILAFALVPLSLNNLTGIILTGMNMIKENLIAISCGLILNIFLNILLINLYGIAGAAIVTILTEVVILIADLYFLRSIIFNPKTKIL